MVQVDLNEFYALLGDFGSAYYSVPRYLGHGTNFQAGTQKAMSNAFNNMANFLTATHPSLEIIVKEANISMVVKNINANNEDSFLGRKIINYLTLSSMFVSMSLFGYSIYDIAGTIFNPIKHESLLPGEYKFKPKNHPQGQYKFEIVSKDGKFDAEEISEILVEKLYFVGDVLIGKS